MNKTLKKLGITFTATALLFSSSLTFAYDIKECPNIALDLVKSVSLYDMESQFEVLSYDCDSQMGIASISKLMTSKILYDAIDRGEISLKDWVPISKNAQSKDGDGLRLRAGDEVRLNDLMHGMLINSSNDSAVALAEYYAGSEAAFAQLMNQEAANLGLTHSHFVNPSGLTEYDANHDPLPAQNVMTLDDLMKLVVILEETHPEIHEITHLEKWTFEQKNIEKTNTNLLLPLYPSINGLKTGYTNFAGYCQVITADMKNLPNNTELFQTLYNRKPSFGTIHDRKLAMALLGGHYKSTRVKTLSSLMDYAQSTLEIAVLTDSALSLSNIQFEGYKAYTADTLTYVNPKNHKIECVFFQNPNVNKSVLTNNASVGSLIFFSGDELIGKTDVIVKAID